MTSLTLLTVAVLVAGLSTRLGVPRSLALAGSTPIGAAAVYGNTAVPTFYAASIAPAIIVILAYLRRTKPDRFRTPIPGSLPLYCLVAYSIALTLMAPFAFSGLDLSGASEADGLLQPGLVTKSNVAQIVYLILGTFVFIYLARSSRTTVVMLGLVLGTTTLLSLWAWLHQATGLPFPEKLFDNSPFFVLQETFPGGKPRVRGILSEPAGLATTALATIAYCLSRLRQCRGLQLAGTLTLLAVATLLGAISTSATFYVAGAFLAALAGLRLVSLSRRQLQISPTHVTVAVLSLTALTIATPEIFAQLSAIVSEKVGSDSYEARTGADSTALALLNSTSGLGTGLGSFRASSFAASMLATIGIPGLILLTCFFLSLISKAWRSPQASPALWTLLAVLVCKVISGPDLSDTSGLLWISTGILASIQLRQSPEPRIGTLNHWPTTEYRARV